MGLPECACDPTCTHCMHYRKTSMSVCRGGQPNLLAPADLLYDIVDYFNLFTQAQTRNSRFSSGSYSQEVSKQMEVGTSPDAVSVDLCMAVIKELSWCVLSLTSIINGRVSFKGVRGW